MAYGAKKWRTKLIIKVEIEAHSKSQCERRWTNTLEKIKYQTTNVHITPQLDPDWIEVEDELEPDQSSD